MTMFLTILGILLSVPAIFLIAVFASDTKEVFRMARTAGKEIERLSSQLENLTYYLLMVGYDENYRKPK